jgi:hypothetical protein
MAGTDISGDHVDAIRTGESASMSRIICSVARWTARTAAVLLAVGFVAFALGEPEGPLDIITPREWAGMALLFAAIMAMLLAWKWELPAALLSLFALGAFAGVVHMRQYTVLIVAAVPNLLFLLDWKLRHPHPAGIAKAP